MENVINNKIQPDKNDSMIINNYNDNIIDNNTKKYIFDFDSLYLKLMQKKKNENNINGYHCNLLMIFFKNVSPFTKINLLRLLYLFNNNLEDSDYIYYIFKKLTKLLKALNDKEMVEINFSKVIDIFLEQGKFLFKQDNYFYSYHCLFNELFRDNPNIRSLRHKVKEILIADNDDNKNYFLKLNHNNYKTILNKLKEISMNEINQDKKETFYVVNNNWLKNAINFVKNILYFNLYEFEEKLKDQFHLNEVYMNYFQYFNNNYEEEVKHLYPGKIDNYSIIDFKDLWKDPLKDDENYLLKENISFKKDYSLANEKNWNIINGAFGSTNIIKRKRNNLQLIKFKIIILDKRFLKNNFDLLKPKYIQTKVQINIREFKEKILRCINHALKNDKLETNYFDMMDEETNRNYKNINLMKTINSTSKKIININFFKMKKVNKKLLIEIFTSYIKGIPCYESVFIEEINLGDNNNLEDIFKLYDKKRDFLIIELIDNESQNFLLPKIYDNQGLYQCSVCKSKISFMERYNCERCNFSIFCSKMCSELESPVNILHNKIHEILKEYQIKLDGDSSMSKYNNLVGLMNLGNTCFINSSLQCLFNIKELSNYFLSDVYLKEINKENSQGSKGLITQGFADLFKEIKTTNSSKLNPIQFLRTFFKINKSLYAGMQHDAQEFLSILLDNLHEDLNRITKKHYAILEEQKKNETDEEASERFWTYHKMREDSIIVDLFHGQFKSKISCVDCGNLSINYEPFIFLGLPIPEKKNRMIIKFAFNNKLEYFGFDLNENSNIYDLKMSAVEHMIMCGYNKNENFEVLINNIEFVFFDNKKIIKKIFNEKNKLYDYMLLKDILNENKSLELVLYEKKIGNNYFNIYAYPIKEYDYYTSSYPIYLSVTGTMSFSEIIEENRQKILNMYVNINENEKIRIGMLHKKNDSWTYYLANIFDSIEYCPVCQKKEDNFCLIHDNIKVDFLFNRLKNYEPILFVMGTKQ